MGGMAERFFTAMVSDKDQIFQPEVCDIDSAITDIFRCSGVIMFIGEEVFAPYGFPSLNSQDYMNLFPPQRYPSFKSSMLDLQTLPYSEEYWDFYQSVQTLFSGFAPADIHQTIARTLLKFNEEGQNLFILTDVKLMKKQINQQKLVDGNIMKQTQQSQPQQQYFKIQQEEESKQAPLLPEYLRNTIIELNGCINKLLNAVIVNQHPSKLLNLQLQSLTIKIPDRSTQFQNLLSQIDRFSCFIKAGSIENRLQVQQIIQKIIENNALIVEVGTNPTLEVGRIKQIIGETSEILDALCEKMREIYY